MYRTIGTALRAATRNFTGVRHRRDDATFIAIAALLIILFVMQLGWVVAQPPQPPTGISRN